MLLQTNYTNVVDLTSMITPVLSLFFIIFLIGLMIFCYLKVRVFLVILVIYLFSLLIGVMFLEIDNIPFTPYLQIFFILIQTIFLIIVSIELYENVKSGY